MPAAVSRKPRRRIQADATPTPPPIPHSHTNFGNKNQVRQLSLRAGTSGVARRSEHATVATYDVPDPGAHQWLQIRLKTSPEGSDPRTECRDGVICRSGAPPVAANASLAGCGIPTVDGTTARSRCAPAASAAAATASTPPRRADQPSKYAGAGAAVTAARRSASAWR